MQMFFAMLVFATSTVMACGQATAAQQPFNLVISTEKSTFKSGDPVPIKVELTNTSNEDLDISSGLDMNSGILYAHLFDVRKDTGEVVPKKTRAQAQAQTGNGSAKPEKNSTGPETAKMIFGLLKPGEKYTITDDISRAYDLSQPGKYTIQVAHPLPGKSKDDVVKSNGISITIAP